MSTVKAPPPRSTSRWLGRAVFLSVMVALLILLTQDGGRSWAQPHQNGLRDTIDTPVPTPTNGPTSTPTHTPGPCVERVLLQQGLDGYEGTLGTWINAWEPEEPQRPSVSRTGILKIKGGDAWSVLIKFDLEGQLPAEAEVIEAQLVLYVEGGTRIRELDVAAYRLLRPWDINWATWRSAAPGERWAVAGANGAGQDRMEEADETITLLHRGVYRGFDVTESVRYWLGRPEDNHGWLLKGDATSTGEFQLLSSLWRSTEKERRPLLRIDYNGCASTATVTPTFTPTSTATPTRTDQTTVTPTYTATVTPTPPPGLVALVYEDSNRNGIREPHETGVAGAIVRLYTLNWDELDMRMTGEGGMCGFGERPAGEYRLKETNASGYFSSTDDQVRIYHSGGQTVVTFGDYREYQVSLPVILKEPGVSGRHELRPEASWR